MEFFQIRYALAVAQSLSFTKAAADCHVSQPALSKAVKVLEEEFGAKLFHREGRRVLVTEFGKAILPRLQRILDEADMTRTVAEDFRLLKKAPVRLGVMSTVGHLRLSRFFAEFERSHQMVELAVTEANVADLVSRLDEGAYDAVILNPRDVGPDRFDLHDLYSERYVVVFPTDHRLAGFDTIALKDLAREPYVDRLACEMRELVMNVCAEHSIELYARFRSDREDWVQAMVLAGIGFAFAPEYSVTLPGLLQRPLVDPTVARSVCLATPRGRPFPPGVTAFIRAVKAYRWPG
jgi:DNA-binding transcriptional LysR family regulator